MSEYQTLNGQTFKIMRIDLTLTNIVHLSDESCIYETSLVGTLLKITQDRSLSKKYYDTLRELDDTSPFEHKLLIA